MSGHTLHELQRYTGCQCQRDPGHPEAVEIPNACPPEPALAAGVYLAAAFLRTFLAVLPDDLQSGPRLHFPEVGGDGRFAHAHLARDRGPVHAPDVQLERLPHPVPFLHHDGSRRQAVQYGQAPNE